MLTHCFFGSCMLLTVYIVTVTVIVDVMRKGVKPKLMDLDYLTQIVQDWETVPLVDIRTTNGKQCPISHPEELFYKLWPGLYPFCDCQNSKDK